ncbi:MAG: hypothetical protein CW346_01620 [Bacillaceae bacterium]|nr:hypothetical protein [Bacillaceae bacterium]
MANTSWVLGLAKRIPISSIPFDRYEKDFMRRCGCFMANQPHLMPLRSRVSREHADDSNGRL